MPMRALRAYVRSRNLGRSLMNTSWGKSSSGIGLLLSGHIRPSVLGIAAGLGGFADQSRRIGGECGRAGFDGRVDGNSCHRFLHCTEARLICATAGSVELRGDCEERFYLRDGSASDGSRQICSFCDRAIVCVTRQACISLRWRSAPITERSMSFDSEDRRRRKRDLAGREWAPRSPVNWDSRNCLDRLRS